MSAARIPLILAHEALRRLAHIAGRRAGAARGEAAVTNAEKLRRLVAARIGVPWRTVRIVLRTGSHRRRRRHYVWPRMWEAVAVTGAGRVVNTSALGYLRRWLVARAVLYAEAGASTLEEFDAVDAAHPPVHGRIGRRP